MKACLKISLFFCLLISFNSNAQIQSDSSLIFQRPAYPWRYFLHESGENFLKQAAAPVHFNRKHWIAASLISLSTLALIPLDPAIDKEVTTWKTNYNAVNKISPVITHLGGNEVIVLPLLYACTGSLFRKTEMVETGLLACQSIIITGLWVRLGKTLSGRERPSAAYSSGVEGGFWSGPSFSSIKGGQKFDAFPSGHTGTVFSLASVYAIRYKHIKWLPPALYSVASAVALSRLTEHTHWASDVFLSAFIGIASSYQICGNHRPFVRKWLKHKEKKNSSSCFLAYPTSNGLKIGFFQTF